MSAETFEESHDVRISLLTDWRQQEEIEPFSTGWYHLQDKAHANRWIIPIPIDIAKDTQDETNRTTWVFKDLLTEDHRETSGKETKVKRTQPYMTKHADHDPVVVWR